MAEDPAFLRNEPQFLAHLEALHRFPGEFEFKIICAGQEVADGVCGRVAEATGLRLLGSPRHKPSTSGKYVSVTAMFLVQAPTDVVRAYHAMRAIEGVIGFL
jgi:putative lipoic acid-binding regulatory protein